MVVASFGRSPTTRFHSTDVFLPLKVCDPTLDVLTPAVSDPDEGVAEMAAASLALLGWAAAGGDRDASLADVSSLTPASWASDSAGWTDYVTAGVITLLRPPSAWSDAVRSYPFAESMPPDFPLPEHLATA